MATLVAPSSTTLAAVTTLAAATAPTGFGRLVRLIAALPRSFGAAVNAARTYESLSGKSDADLARMGLTRQDLPTYVARIAFDQD